VNSLDEHRGLIEAYLERIVFNRDLGFVDGVMRYALSGGGKRIRPVLCLATGVLAGDALLAQAFDLALTLSMVEPARELADATLGMIAGQYRDIKERGDLRELYELKTGRLFEAAVACGLWVARVPVVDHGPWRMFGKEFGLLFQILDDIADGDGLVGELGRDEAHALAMKTEGRARLWLDEIAADTSLLDELLSGLKTRAVAS